MGDIVWQRVYLESFGAPFSLLKMNPGRKRKISLFDCDWHLHENSHVTSSFKRHLAFQNKIT